MSKQILSEEFLRMQKLAGIITEAVEVPTWLKGKLEDVHVKPGQGSIFAKPIDNVLKLAQDTLDKIKDIDHTLSLIIDPLQREISMEVLVEKYNYPIIDLTELDMDHRINYF